MREMRLLVIGLDGRHNSPVLLLKETGGRRVLPVWVGVAEATAIEALRQHTEAPRPTSHHLIANVIAAFGQHLDHVRIAALRGSVFHGELVLGDDVRISARVSDAIALALHLEVPIRAEDAVLDEAAYPDVQGTGIAGELVVEADEEPSNAPDLTAEEAAEVERLRRFIDSVSPEDFDR